MKNQTVITIMKLGEIAGFYSDPEKAFCLLLHKFTNKHPRLWINGEFNNIFLNSERRLRKKRQNQEKSIPKPG